MARKSSTRPGSRKSNEKAPDSVAPDSAAPEPAGELGGDTIVLGNDTVGEDVVTPEPAADDRATIEAGKSTSADPVADDPTPTGILEAETVTPEDTPSDVPRSAAVAPVVHQRGPGLGALLIGGVVAAALGYAAAFFGTQNTPDTSEIDAALSDATAAIEAQQGTIAALEAQVTALAAIEPPVVPEVDLSGVEGSIASVANDIAGMSTGIEALTGRIVALEERPIFTGEVAEDSAAMAAAVEALEARLSEERTAASEALASAEAAQAAAATEVQEASSAAQAAIAEAEARTQATAAAIQTQAALSRVRIAMASGDPFSNALADLPTEIPEALSAVAETGVPTIEELQAAFPDAARAALPIALRETAGDGTANRVGAFLMGQIGGRSVEPREGADPDAVLSRAEAAVGSGNLRGALNEISALPEGAQATLQDWVGQVETRIAADTALADFAATLDQ